MILTPESTWVRVANYYEEGEDNTPGVFISISGSSNGQHGYRDKDGKYVDDIPAGDPLRGSVYWEFSYDSYPKVGAEFMVWMGAERGSFHERWNDIYVTSGKEKPGEKDGITYRKHSTLKPIGDFKFSNIVDCCQKVIQLTGCRPPSDYDFADAIPPRQDSDPVIKPEQENKARPGESSEQYWKRIVDEQLGKYHYRHEGD